MVMYIAKAIYLLPLFKILCMLLYEACSDAARKNKLHT